MKINFETIKQLVDTTTKEKGIYGRCELNTIDEKEAKAIKEATNLEVLGYKRMMDSYGINHTLDKHANQTTEKKRGQEGITLTDFEKITEIVAEPDQIEYAGKTKQGRDVIKYSKEIEQTYFYVEEVREGKKEVVLQTMYKRNSKK